MIKRSLLVLFLSAVPLLAQQNPDFHREFPPFKIAGNLYWVGTADLAVYLINTPQGNILINSDFPEDVPAIKKSIAQLGFKYGDTKGCTTWTMQVDEGGRKLNAVIIGSPNVNRGTILVGNKNYPQIADDYVKTFKVLKSLPVDYFLGAHGNYFGLKAKYEKMKA